MEGGRASSLLPSDIIDMFFQKCSLQENFRLLLPPLHTDRTVVSSSYATFSSFCSWHTGSRRQAFHTAIWATWQYEGKNWVLVEFIQCMLRIISVSFYSSFITSSLFLSCTSFPSLLLHEGFPYKYERYIWHTFHTYFNIMFTMPMMLRWRRQINLTICQAIFECNRTTHDYKKVRRGKRRKKVFQGTSRTLNWPMSLSCELAREWREREFVSRMSWGREWLAEQVDYLDSLDLERRF